MTWERDECLKVQAFVGKWDNKKSEKKYMRKLFAIPLYLLNDSWIKAKRLENMNYVELKGNVNVKEPLNLLLETKKKKRIESSM